MRIVGVSCSLRTAQAWRRARASIRPPSIGSLARSLSQRNVSACSFAASAIISILTLPVFAIVATENGWFLSVQGKEGKVQGTKDAQVWQIEFADGYMQLLHEATGKYMSVDKSAFGGGEVLCKGSFVGIPERWQLCANVQRTHTPHG